MAERLGTKVYGYTAQGDLCDRALSLGYTGEAAARLADCFTNWDRVTDPCALHPNHSTSVRDGYAVDGCEACEVIRMTDDAGWVPSVKPTAVKRAVIHLSDGKVVEPAPGLPATWTFWQMNTPEGGTQVVWVVLTHEAEPSRGPDGVVVFDGTILAGRQHVTLTAWQGMQRMGSLRQIDAPAQPCRNNGHEYCANGCAMSAWVLAARRTSRTTVETEQQCAGRIKRGDYRVGDLVNFATRMGYVNHDSRPWDCRRRFVCQCGTCDGVAVDNWQHVIEVIGWVSGGLDIRGANGAYRSIRPDRLD